MTKIGSGKHIVVLISRFLAGAASDDEVRELDLWRGEHAENEQLMQELSGREFWQQKMSELQKTDLIGAYLQVMDKSRTRKVRRRVRWTAVAAASLMLPLAVGLWLGLNRPIGEVRNEFVSVEDATEVIVPGEVKAELFLADGSKIHLDGKPCDSLTEQAGSMIVARGQGLEYTGGQQGNELVYNTLKIPRGGEYTLILGDGTIVYLNSETVLKYPVQFVGNERKVELSGEAYFEVRHDEAHPFIVKTAHSEVKVLGTSFNFRSYPDEKQVAATLVSGKVDFIADNRQKVALSPGEQAVMNEDGKVSKKEVETYLYTAWKDGDFVFHKQRLEEVMRVVARWYDVEVHFIDANQRNVSFTGNVKRYDDFSKIVRMLEMTGNTRFEIDGKNIFIREK